MEVLFIDADYTGEVKLCQETLGYLKKFKSVGLFASVQFIKKLENVEKQLSKLGIKTVNSKPSRAHAKGQLLGCNVYHDSLNLDQEVDCYLYIGDGKFHPLALVYSQKEAKEVICDDPIEKKMIVLTKEDVEKNLKKQKGSLVKFHSSKNIGVIVTIKPGQEQYKCSLVLEEKYPNKKFYYFVDNNISFDQLENFPFVDIWINTACPRIGLDDQEMFRKGVVNLMDVL